MHFFGICIWAFAENCNQLNVVTATKGTESSERMNDFKKMQTTVRVVLSSICVIPLVLRTKVPVVVYSCSWPRCLRDALPSCVFYSIALWTISCIIKCNDDDTKMHI